MKANQRVWRPTRYRSRKKSRPRPKVDREKLEERLSDWLREAHRTDRLAQLWPVDDILSPKSITALSRLVSGSIASVEDVTACLDESPDWSESWGPKILDVITKFDRHLETLKRWGLDGRTSAASRRQTLSTRKEKEPLDGTHVFNLQMEPAEEGRRWSRSRNSLGTANPASAAPSTYETMFSVSLDQQPPSPSAPASALHSPKKHSRTSSVDDENASQLTSSTKRHRGQDVPRSPLSTIANAVSHRGQFVLS